MIGCFASICPFLISGNSLSDFGEFSFRFQVFLFYATEMFSFSITVPLVFTARLNLRANCDGAFKYVIKGKHGCMTDGEMYNSINVDKGRTRCL